MKSFEIKEKENFKLMKTPENKEKNNQLKKEIKTKNAEFNKMLKFIFENNQEKELALYNTMINIIYFARIISFKNYEQT